MGKNTVQGNCVRIWYLVSVEFNIYSVYCFFLFQAQKGGLVMINFFSYFLTCSNHSTVNDVIGKRQNTICHY